MQYILSAYKKEYPLSVNMGNHLALGETLVNVFGDDLIIETFGTYQGVQERGYMLTINDGFYTSKEIADEILAIAVEYSQECILEIDQLYQATLVFNNGSFEFIGHWVQVESLDRNTDYSVINGKYYTVKGL